MPLHEEYRRTRGTLRPIRFALIIRDRYRKRKGRETVVHHTVQLFGDKMFAVTGSHGHGATVKDGCLVHEGFISPNEANADGLADKQRQEIRELHRFFIMEVILPKDHITLREMRERRSNQHVASVST